MALSCHLGKAGIGIDPFLENAMRILSEAEGMKCDTILLTRRLVSRCCLRYSCLSEDQNIKTAAQKVALVCVCAWIATKWTGGFLSSHALVWFGKSHGANFSVELLCQAESNLLCNVLYWNIDATTNCEILC